MPSYTAKVGNIVRVDSSLVWTITAPVGAANGDQFMIANLADDITPISIVLPSGTVSLRLPGVNVGIWLTYDALNNDWIPTSAIEPDPLWLNANNNGWLSGNLGGAWIPIEWTNATSRHITFVNASDFRFDMAGVYMLNLVASIEHNSSNSGRTTNLRLQNITQGIEGVGLLLGTGRNAEATTATVPLVVSVANPGDVFALQVGNGDAYSAVSWPTLSLQIVSTYLDVLT